MDSPYPLYHEPFKSFDTSIFFIRYLFLYLHILNVADLSKSCRIDLVLWDRGRHEHLFLRITVLNSTLNTGCDFVWKYPLRKIMD